jgi:hypothetical protein
VEPEFPTTEIVYVLGPPAAGLEDLPPPQDAVSMTLPIMTHATIAGSARRAFLKFPKNTDPAIPKDKIQLAYAKPFVRGG